MKKIDTLVEDIYGLFRGKHGSSIRPEDVEGFGKTLTLRISNTLSEERQAPSLRLSGIGSPCDRKLWYSINEPERGESLSPSTRIKFLFGHILEELLFFLARAAGHKVEREQEEVEINGVKGHIDGLIDGELVDAKSASSYSFKKFQSGGLPEDDPFGYLGQLGAYANGLGKSRGAFLVIDKTLGKICLDKHDLPVVDYNKVIAYKREMLASKTPPARFYEDVADGKSGNRKLCMECSYCSFKKHCWPGVRIFQYSRGPVFLTQVWRQPDVPEIENVEDDG